MVQWPGIRTALTEGDRIAMAGSFSLGRIRGVMVEVNWGWLIGLPLLVATLATGWFPQTVPGLNGTGYVTLAVVSAALYVGSVALHEVGHALAARYHERATRAMTLYFFGGVTDLEREPHRPGEEFRIALAGPVVNLFIGALASWIGALLTNPNLPAVNGLGANPLVTSLLRYIEYSNVLLGLFNLLPGFPLDGGRALRAVLWRNGNDLPRATQITALLGQIIGYALIVIGIIQFFTQDAASGLWIGVAGALTLEAAQAERGIAASASVLTGALVEDAMLPVVETIPPSLTLKRFMADYAAKGVRAAPVVEDDALVGLVTLRDAQAAPQARRDTTPVSQIMVPLSHLHILGPETPLEDALPLLTEHDVNQAPVVREGRIVGMLNREAILRYLVVRRGLSPAEAEREVEEELPAAP
jgi:Zn-dependent protease/CBS domain-containing protein